MDHSKDAKVESLRTHLTLNPHPDRVTDSLFLGSEFFDSRDLVQVKYEMLRRVRVDQESVTQAASVFGFSRPAFYQALVAFQTGGIPGLIHKRPGPKQAHKLSEEVLAYIQEQRELDEALHAPELSQRVLKKFRLSVHPRSIERALLRQQKKGL